MNRKLQISNLYRNNTSLGSITGLNCLFFRLFVFVGLLGTASSLYADITITGSFNRTAAEWESGNLTTNAFLANNGSATLIVDGGSILNLGGNTNLFGTGQAAPPNTATVTITDPGSQIVTSRGITIGNNTGVGLVSIFNGARLVNTERAELGGGNLGDASTSIGSVTVDGLGSVWEANGGINVGQFAQGSVTIQNQGQVTSTELFVARGQSATGSLDVIGTGGVGANALTLSSTLAIQEGGTALISNGASVDAGGVFSIRGLATLQNPNTSITSSDFTYISSADRNATLTIEDGAQGSTDRTILGSDTGEGSNNSGTLNVMGNGSSWTSLRVIEIGTANGDGALNITDGGLVTVINTNQVVRIRSGSLNLNNGMLVTGQVDARGPGTAMIDNGMLRLTDNQASLFDGFVDGDVVLNGGGASIDTQSFNVSINIPLNGSGGLTKQGTGSLTLNEASNYNGNTIVANGTLLVNNTMGSATGPGEVNVDSGATLGGAGAISGNVTTAGTVAPGNSAGRLTIGGNYTQEASGTLLLEIGGTTSGTDYDVLNLNGASDLRGTIEVQLINGYSPAAGEQFTLITSNATITDSGVSITLPTLPTDRIWSVTLDATSLVLEVISLNDPPVADDQAVSTNEDTAVTITLTGLDLDDDPLTFSVASDPSDGTLGAIIPVSDTSAEITYTPDADFNGSDSLTFIVNDGTIDSEPATVTITVQPVNDPPTFTNIGDVDINANEDGDLIWADNISPGPADESGQIVMFDVTNVQNPAFFDQLPAIDSSGRLTFTLNVQDLGAVSSEVTVEAFDDGGTDNGGVFISDPVTFVIDVFPVADLSIDKTSGASFVDPGGTITYTIVVSNNGPSEVIDAVVIDEPPLRLGDLSWDCTEQGDALCGNLSGIGPINETVSFLSNSSVTYSLTGTLQDMSNEPITNVASVTPPDGVTELFPGDNTDSDTDAVGLFADSFESEEPD